MALRLGVAHLHSFDPVHDRPEVLAKYASLNFWPEEGYLTHSQHTLVIDRGGRLAIMGPTL